MDKPTLQYTDTWPTKPVVAILASIATVFFSFASTSLSDVPFFIQIIFGICALIGAMVAMGAAISTTVEVNSEEDLSIIRKMAGFPFNTIRIPSNQILGIELNRQISAKSEKSSRMGANPSTPRFQINIVYAQGKILLIANASNLEIQATRLANALHCPMHKKGDWHNGGVSQQRRKASGR